MAEYLPKENNSHFSSAMLCRLLLATVAIFLNASIFAQEADANLVRPLFRGTLVLHFPLAAFPADSAGGSYFWIPIPEMGFSFCPTIEFSTKNGFWEFPVHILTFFPFLDKYAALGDISFGAGFQIPPKYKMGIAYRLIGGRFYPVKARFIAHIIETDIALPISGFSGAGAKFDWLFHSTFDMDAPYTSGGKSYDHYQGSIFALAPYWRLPLKYGQLTLSYRIVVSSKLTGTDSKSQSSYQVKTRSVSAFEINYTYP